MLRFTFPLFVFFMLVACNAARRIPMEALGGITGGATTRFVIPREDVEKEATAFLRETSGSACRADIS
jgi:hypothetical protein